MLSSGASAALWGPCVDDKFERVKINKRRFLITYEPGISDEESREDQVKSEKINASQRRVSSIQGAYVIPNLKGSK
jgi:hypothetical protein